MFDKSFYLSDFYEFFYHTIYVITKPSNIAILLKIIKDNQTIDNISIIKNNKGYFK